ncbi:uncharacterized protein CCOS01_06022 [Colletotrichum costaricense]|uniref:Uncharacterized protein n=1 Tax=Colletotrichum costaricense TaxID=1209916 RepID=A0AAI9Z197_9PEZI|nr:uncharacterized protein CCOS01_06022 [Colletotrichum costaricense]KAK1530919.1 hypothetical protein CCOS01_06022 [Colletotrichum costaricense]
MTDNSLFAGLGGMEIARFGRRQIKKPEPRQAITAIAKCEREFFCLPLRDLRLIVTDKITYAFEVSDHSRSHHCGYGNPRKSNKWDAQAAIT